ncbi:hypothetical protein AALP_AA7G204300 [Arabis alpina]|uniref:Uncharacterized protein n=1 Tax=Arabis alpina TaxID=50452 RepID=A0A087GJE5_ARAAL|nr:hypothetical protein AALP_AA7G204300 [Arabis alpina]
MAKRFNSCKCVVTPQEKIEYKTNVSRNSNMSKLQAGYLFPEQPNLHSTCIRSNSQPNPSRRQKENPKTHLRVFTDAAWRSDLKVAVSLVIRNQDDETIATETCRNPISTIWQN